MPKLDDLVDQIGVDRAYKILERYKDRHLVENEHVLTIISNMGVHHIPENILVGEVFVASEGNLDFSTPKSIRKEIDRILGRISTKLKSKKWKHVYIVPFGPCIISMQIKLLVYRVTRIESVDLFYVGGEYVELAIDQREIIVGSQ